MEGKDFKRVVYETWVGGSLQGRSEMLRDAVGFFKDETKLPSEASLCDKFRRTPIGKELEHVKGLDNDGE